MPTEIDPMLTVSKPVKTKGKIGSKQSRAAAGKKLGMETPDDTPRVTFRCPTCGCEYKKQKGNFYASKSSLYANNNGYVTICRTCCEGYYFKLMDIFNSDGRKAVELLCALMDLFYSDTIYDQAAKDDGTGTTLIARYIMKMNLSGNSSKGTTYLDTILNTIDRKSGIFGHASDDDDTDLELTPEESQVIDRPVCNWSESDVQNKKFVVSTCGYDPFDYAGMSDDDRRNCYNILASYCESDDVNEDGHKLQSVIQIAHTEFQCNKINEIVNTELLKSSPDDTLIKNLSMTKGTLLNSISTMAKDNGIASAYNKSQSASKSTLSAKIKEMNSVGFDDAKVNKFTIETAEAMKQIADLSNQSIMEQLAWDANDYTKMIKEQREALVDLNQKFDALSEENRLLKNQITTYRKREANE